MKGNDALAGLLERGEREFDLDGMQQWAEALAKALPRPAVVTLSGDLGAGKTTVARALCAGFGVTDPGVVASPTFAIIHEYEAQDGPIVHGDLYRLDGDAALDALGWDEVVANARVLIVEWPERSARPWPAGTVRITLADAGSNGATRRLAVERS